MSKWIHCNKCFTKYESGITFYLTNCRHIKCQSCISKMGPSKTCLVCKAVCEIIQLSNDLNPDVMCFFQPAKQLLDKAGQVSEFQLNNALSLLGNYIAKYSVMKSKVTKSYQAIYNLKKQQQQLKTMIKDRARAAKGANNASMMSGDTSFNFTPTSNASSAFLQFNGSNPKCLPWMQRQNAARMNNQRQYPNVRSVFGTSLDTTSQANSTAPFDLGGSPNDNLDGKPSSSRNRFPGQYPHMGR